MAAQNKYRRILYSEVQKKMIAKFIEQITNEKIIDLAKAVQIGDDHFLPTETQKKYMKRGPCFIGLHLGSYKNGIFEPSNWLLQKILQAKDAKKAVLNKKQAWLFVCGRDIPLTKINELTGKTGDTILVINERKECLGYGIAKEDALKNVYDIGMQMSHNEQ